jgi:hypothetical protein
MDRLYLFNSALFPNYRSNVLNTLFLPEGHANYYRYSITRQVSPEQLVELKQLDRGTPVLVTFIDRFGGDYRFYPLRIGKLLKIEEDSSRLYFHVCLGKIVYPNDIEDFNRQILATLGPLGLPRLTNSDPTCTEDGYYALLGNELAPAEGFHEGEQAWDSIVSALSKTNRYISSENDKPLFIRARIVRKGLIEREVKPKTSGTKSYFRISRGGNYELHLNYQFPSQLGSTHSLAKVTVEPDEHLKFPDGSEQEIAGVKDRVLIRFSARRLRENNQAGLKLVYESNSVGQTIVSPDSPLSVRLYDPVWFWVQAVLLLLLYAVFNGLLNTQLPTNVEPTFLNLINWGWMRMLLSIPLAFIVFLMVKVIGSKTV